MKVFDLLIPEFSAHVSGNSTFPYDFYNDDGLFEATLLDLLHYALYSTTALIIDLRTSMYYFDQGNTLVIVFRGVKEMVLTENFDTPHVWMIGDSKFTKAEYGIGLSLPLIGKTIKIVARKADVYIGNAKNIGEVGTSLDEGITSFLHTTPHWDSEFEVVAMSEWRS